MLKSQIDQDLKKAMLARDTQRVQVLRGLKSAILYEEVAKKVRDAGLDEPGILVVLAREAKKRAESADIYQKAGEANRAAAEQAEKAIIEAYLPTQLDDAQLAKVVNEIFTQLGPDVQMGQLIGAVKQKVGPQADGARIAALAKQKMA